MLRQVRERVDGHEQRLVRVEADARHVPTHGDMAAIQTELARLGGQIQTQSATMKGIADAQRGLVASTDRINDYLLRRAMCFSTFLAEHRRIAISCLGEGDYSANESLLADFCASRIGATRDQVRSELTWLGEQGSWTLRTISDVMIARISERGLEVAAGRVAHPGVKRRRHGTDAVSSRSTVRRLPPEIRSQIDAMIRDGRATIDELVDYLQEQGQEISRSAMGRYKQDMEISLKRLREAREMAAYWVAKLGEDQQGDIGRLVQELLKNVALRATMGMDDGDKAAKSTDIMRLAKAIKDLESSGKLSLERELRVRQETAKAAAAAVERVARGAGLTAETIEKSGRQLG